MNMKYKNFPSKYELQYVKWNGIEFDKERLIKFNRRLILLGLLSFIPRFNEEYNIMKDILNLYDKEKLRGLLNNDEHISRISFIEKWSRIAATDVLLNNVYSRTTFTTISNLPITDYKLIIKRSDEIIDSLKNLTYQKEQ